jgi:hypothetical protein
LGITNLSRIKCINFIIKPHIIANNNLLAEAKHFLKITNKEAKRLNIIGWRAIRSPWIHKDNRYPLYFN